MSLLSGKTSVSTALKKKIATVADESFTRNVALTADELPPAPEGWVMDQDTLIAVKLRGYCDPHTDEFLGRGAPDTAHKSLFWLVSDTSKRRSKLMADGTYLDMLPGDWAVFDDSQLHAFLADGTWVGVAVQMREAETGSPD